MLKVVKFYPEIALI